MPENATATADAVQAFALLPPAPIVPPPAQRLQVHIRGVCIGDVTETPHLPASSRWLAGLTPRLVVKDSRAGATPLADGYCQGLGSTPEEAVRNALHNGIRIAREMTAGCETALEEMGNRFLPSRRDA